jgi:hypothetical protein
MRTRKHNIIFEKLNQGYIAGRGCAYSAAQLKWCRRCNYQLSFTEIKRRNYNLRFNNSQSQIRDMKIGVAVHILSLNWKDAVAVSFNCDDLNGKQIPHLEKIEIFAHNVPALALWRNSVIRQPRTVAD